MQVRQTQNPNAVHQYCDTYDAVPAAAFVIGHVSRTGNLVGPERYRDGAADQGPRAAETPLVDMTIPMYLFLSLKGTRSQTMRSSSIMMPPEPMPWMLRPTMSIPTLVAPPPRPLSAAKEEQSDRGDGDPPSNQRCWTAAQGAGVRLR